MTFKARHPGGWLRRYRVARGLAGFAALPMFRVTVTKI
jgi:hypothetical protein